MSVGRLDVITGCMFSGKSEELIRRLRRAKIGKLRVISFKPVIDNRYDALAIASHVNQTVDATPVTSIHEAALILSNYNGHYDVVGIDEAQFFDTTITSHIRDMVRVGLQVIVAGLDTDYRGEPFGAMPELMAIADTVLKLSAICVKCGAPAIHTHRLTTSTELIQVGATNMYDARCRICFDPEGGE